jgi:tight adherence protein B
MAGVSSLVPGLAAAVAILAGAVALGRVRAAVAAGRATRRLAPAPAPHAGGWPVLVGLPVVAGPVARVQAWRQAEGLERGLPGWLDAVARGLRSGASLRTAMVEAAAPSRGTGMEGAAAGLAHLLARGDGLAASVEATFCPPSGRPGPGAALVARSLPLVAEVGGAPAQLVDSLATSVRDRQAARQEVRSLSTQARASAAVIVAAPVVFTALVAASDSRVAGFLLGSPVGWLLVLAGVALDVLGGWWMAHLVRRAAP